MENYYIDIMEPVLYSDNPSVLDTVKFIIKTTDANNNAVNVYSIKTVSIYFIQRNFSVGDVISFTSPTNNLVYQYSSSLPVFYLNDPAWLSTNTNASIISQINYDSKGNPVTGQYQFDWVPEVANIGDYYVCWTWLPTELSQPLSDFLTFNLTTAPATDNPTPGSSTTPGKYLNLLTTYLPSIFKEKISDNDLTTEHISALNQVIAYGFTKIEDTSNQIYNLLNPNTINATLLNYLSNLFNIVLYSTNPTLWRLQIENAIPLLKQKGTYIGLVNAFNYAGMKLDLLTKYFQCRSSSTFQQNFIVNNNNSWTLEKIPILTNPLDSLNFAVSIRYAGTSNYISLTTDYVQFATSMGISTVTWVGNLLSINPITIHNGDSILVLYKFAPVQNQSVENYIRSLPLADTSDETTKAFPPKNWNIKLITESDSFFHMICPYGQSSTNPVVFGQIRNEFAYSENIYNMDEYNSSLRDSTNPCDIARDFLDDCGCCYSSLYSLDITVNELSDYRINEIYSIVSEYVPFNYVLYGLTVSGSIDDVILPPIENIQILITNMVQDNIPATELDFNRSIQPNYPNKNRSNLATSSTVASGSGLGQNNAVILYTPNYDFDINFSGINLTNNLLEILTGVYTGNYNVTNPNGSTIDIVQSSSFSSSLNHSEFFFRLSNLIHQESGASIYQDNLIILSDINVVFAFFSVQPNWYVKINLVNYPIVSLNSNNTLIISGWTGTTSNVTYQIYTNTNVLVTTSTTGIVNVTNRGKVVTSSLAGAIIGDYVLFSGNQYLVTDFIDANTTHILGYSGGNVVGAANVTFYRRLLDNARGFLGWRGMVFTTPTNYYISLNVTTTLDNSNHIDNFNLQIAGNNYRILTWVGNVMTISGSPIMEWSTTGTPNVSFNIIQSTYVSPVIVGDNKQYNYINRNNQEYIVYDVAIGSPLNLVDNNNGFSDNIKPGEKITFTIEYKE